jgi:hypothetical protein
MAELASMSERRPALTTSARGGVAYPTVGAEECLRRGRTKEWEQRNEKRIDNKSPIQVHHGSGCIGPPNTSMWAQAFAFAGRLPSDMVISASAQSLE